MTTTPTWLPTLADLLGTPEDDPVAGAELVVADGGGHELYRAALARHYRHEPGDPPTLWIRPLNDGYVPVTRSAGEPAHLFALNETRRRALSCTGAEVIDGALQLHLANGERATIGPVHDDRRHQLAAWDNFMLVLPAEDETALDELHDDSWHGRWA